MRHVFLPAVALCLFAACEPAEADRPFSDEERGRVLAVIQAYAAGWENMDTSATLALFTEDAVLSPSGREPINGLEAIRAFWYPGDGSVTNVHSYDIEVIESGGSDDLAWSHERGMLSFTYTRGEMSVLRKTTSYATTMYRRTASGEWKIFRRMWTDLRFGE